VLLLSDSYHSRFAGPAPRRVSPRVPTFVEVDYRTEGTFLFTSFGERVATAPLGIFVRTEDPLPQGTQLQLHFAAPSALPGSAFELFGEVVWTTRDAERTGMGVRFFAVEPSELVRLLELVRTIAYVDAFGAN
jgi:uncharacterized protein (TIGR02266 family)